MSDALALATTPASPLREFAAGYARSRIAVTALAVLLLILAVAICAPLISPQNPYDLAQLDIMDSKLAPGSKSGAGRGLFPRNRPMARTR